MNLVHESLRADRAFPGKPTFLHTVCLGLMWNTPLEHFMAQLATQPEDLSCWVPGAHMLNGKNLTPAGCPLASTYKCWQSTHTIIIIMPTITITIKVQMFARHSGGVLL